MPSSLLRVNVLSVDFGWRSEVLLLQQFVVRLLNFLFCISDLAKIDYRILEHHLK